MRCRRACAAGSIWLLFNVFLARPFFARVNARALGRWRCAEAGAALEQHRWGNSSGLEVIVAGVGRSGTTSMQAALEAMGLRTYKHRELSFYLPEIVRNASSALTLDGMAATIRACKVKALTPEPLYALTPQLVRLSPGVKVIFTWRDWGLLHNSSRRALVSPWLLGDILARLLCDWMPYSALWPPANPGRSFLDASLGSLLVEHCRRSRAKVLPVYGRFSPHMNSKNITERKVAVLEYYAHLKGIVNPGAFLDFDYKKHGWSDLATFLGRPVPPDGTPFPRLRSRTISRVALQWQLGPRRYCTFCLLLLASVAANALACAAAVALLRHLALQARRALGKGKRE